MLSDLEQKVRNRPIAITDILNVIVDKELLKGIADSKMEFKGRKK